jgi:AraC-like DNA-binding protein
MSINVQFILILSALGSINGLLIALYLWGLQPKKLANRFFAVMLLMLSIRTIKSVLFYFNPEITKTILQIGLSACFLIGPLLYFFCLSQLNQLKGQKLRWQYHLSILIFIILLVGMIYPYNQNPELWGGLIYKLINYTWLLYIMLSVNVVFSKLSGCFKFKKFKQDDVWLMSVFIGNVIIWFAYFTASYTSYIVGALSFSFIIFIACLLVMFKVNNKAIKVKYADKDITKNEANELINQLHFLMENEMLYKNSLITMPQVAKRLGIPTPRFSQLLNNNLNKSFSVYINELRVEEVKAMIMFNSSQTLETISEQCGFNSQSTFYSVFKKTTGLTPAKFRSQNTTNL